MIPPGCHSNGYSVIHKAAIEEGAEGGERVCTIDVSGIASNNHPGGLRSGRKTRGWRPWKQINGTTATISGVCLDLGGSSFWMNKNGMGGAAQVTTSYCDIYKKVQAVDEHGDLVYDEHGDRVMVDVFKERRHYISGISGTSLDGQHFSGTFGLTFDREKMKLNRTGSHVFFIEPECDRLMLAQNVRLAPGQVLDDRASIKWFRPRVRERFDAGEDTHVRPYIIPEVSIQGWDPIYPPYGHDETDRVDWRFNPKSSAAYERVDREKINPLEYGGMTKAESIVLMNEAFDPGPRADGLSGLNPEWRQWDSIEDLVMLYAMQGTKIFRTYIDDQGERQKEYIRTDWKPIYWNPEGGATTDPPLPWGISLFQKLCACEESYPGTRVQLLKEGMKDLISDEDAFDLRLLCTRYNWKAKPIVQDPKTGTYAPDKNKANTVRGYFNTLCVADVRRVARTHPR